MLFGKYKFFSKFSSDAVLPVYKGSTFRGAFGVALKKTTCVLKSDNCDGCPLTSRCVYHRVFEVKSNGAGNNSANIPHPFVIEPPPTTREYFAAGDNFDFELLLFGFANDLLKYFVFAFEEMGRIGLGKMVGPRRAGFKLIRVSSNSALVFDASDRIVRCGHEFDLPFYNNPDSSDSELELTINLETPLRLKFNNQFSEDLPFHVLVRSMLRRISSLHNTFDQGEPSLDYPGLIKRAENVRTVKSSLEWLDWSRFSNRQHTRMQLGGLIGSVTFAGKLEEYINLIKYCEIVHIGKATTFGLGKIGLNSVQ